MEKKKKKHLTNHNSDVWSAAYHFKETHSKKYHFKYYTLTLAWHFVILMLFLLMTVHKLTYQEGTGTNDKDDQPFV